jgi:dynein heavy chain
MNVNSTLLLILFILNIKFCTSNIDEELDPMLDPVLEKNVVKDGASMVIKLGDKMVEWDENFKLFFK